MVQGMQTQGDGIHHQNEEPYSPKKFPQITRGKTRTMNHFEQHRDSVRDDLKGSYDDQVMQYAKAKERTHDLLTESNKPDLTKSERKRIEGKLSFIRSEKFMAKQTANDMLHESGAPKLPPSSREIFK